MMYNIVKGDDIVTIQVGTGILEACVLAVLHKEDVYGYKLTQEIRSIMNVSESTLYPVLRRLVQKGYLETYDKEYMGRNRRYYHLTVEGILEHDKNVKEWKSLSEKISMVLEGGVSK